MAISKKQQAISSSRKTPELIARFLSKVAVVDIGCWEWRAAKGIKGYGVFGLGGTTVAASRLSYHLFVGEVPPELAVCHTCDNPGCVRPDHLFLGTLTDNNRDMWDKGRHYFQKPEGAHMLNTKGMKNGNSKLTEAQVLEIRSSTGASHVVAARYGVSSSMIRHIRNGRNWKSW